MPVGCGTCKGRRWVTLRREDGYTVMQQCPVCRPHRRLVPRGSLGV